MNTTTNTNDTNETNITKYNKTRPELKLYKIPNKCYVCIGNINYIPIGLIKSLCGNDRIFAKDLKPYCFKPTPKVVENTNIIVKFTGK
jgi:hypothetical protein